MGLTAFFEQYKGAILDELPDFSNVAAGQRALCRPPLGQSYLYMMLSFTIAGVAATKGQIETQVANIRILVDGIVKFELTGIDAVYIAEYYRANCVSSSGVLPIFFARPWMETLVNQDAPSWGLQGIDSFTIEVTLAGGATINAIRGFAYTTENEPLGDHIVTTRLGRNFGSAGLETINDLPIDPSWTLYAMHIATATVINQIEVLADGARMAIGTPAVLNRRLLYSTSPRGVQANYNPVEFAPRNRNIDALPLVMQKLQTRVTWNAAPGGYGIITEVVQKAPIKGVPQG